MSHATPSQDTLRQAVQRIENLASTRNARAVDWEDHRTEVLGHLLDALDKMQPGAGTRVLHAMFPATAATPQHGFETLQLWGRQLVACEGEYSRGAQLPWPDGGWREVMFVGRSNDGVVWYVLRRWDQLTPCAIYTLGALQDAVHQAEAAR